MNDEELEQALRAQYGQGEEVEPISPDDEKALSNYVNQLYPGPDQPDTEDVLGDAWHGVRLGGRELKEGAEQLYDRFAGDKEALAQLQRDIAAGRAEYDALGGAGKTGYWAAKIVPWLLATAVTKRPVLSGALIGGASGALEPTLDSDTVGGAPAYIANPAIGALTGGAGGALGAKMSGAAATRLAAARRALQSQAAQNAERDAAARAAHEAGYRLMPSEVRPGARSNIAEGVSGRSALSNTMELHNTNVTDMLARKALGLPEDAPLSAESIQAVRDQANKSYDAIAGLKGQVKADDEFQAAVDAIGKPMSLAKGEFPSSTKNTDIERLLGDLNNGNFSTAGIVQKVRLLRAHAAKNFKSDQPEKVDLARAQRQGADALDGLLSRWVGAQEGIDPDVFDSYTLARKRLAISHDIENAMEQGHVDPTRLARMRRPRSSDPNMRVMGDTAKQFPRSVGNPSSRSGMSPFEGWSLAASIPSSMIHPALGVLAGIPALRMGARYGIASRIGQKLLAQPRDYEPGMIHWLPSKLPYRGALSAGLPPLGREYFKDRPE